MEAPSPRGSRAILEIDGMKTVHCVRAVFQALAGVPGVTRAEVSIGRADIDMDKPVPRDTLSAALEVVGYRVASATPAPRSLPLLHDD
ncbi:MAG: heavy-metal-associated domain-containing protein [Cytophagaceae bacterium]|nr:heavy-metal-associated domain-containing protein [Gemmatimonadaceae bacterium]